VIAGIGFSKLVGCFGQLMKSSQVQLIVNGDDFGASEHVNEAVIQAFKRGILTSCSLMVSGDAFDHAVRLARENVQLGVGIHLVTVLGRSVLPHSQIPHLVDKDGNFPSDPTIAGLRYYFSMAARKELKRELQAQFEKFASTGLKFSHIDSHLHMHVHPVIFDAALDLGDRFDVRRMRVPQDELRIALGFGCPNKLKTTGYAAVFYLLVSRMRKRLRNRGFLSTGRVYGNFQSGKMSEKYVLYVLDRLHARTNELYFHPAIHNGELPLDDQQRQCYSEFNILISPTVAHRIQERGIRLTNYVKLDD
jgi:hopanoid biosynthesis associated protein HpnK